MENDQRRAQCAFEDVFNENPFNGQRCEFHKTVHRRNSPAKMKSETKVKLALTSMGSYRTSGSTSALLKDMGGSDRIKIMCTRFYALCFKDATLSKFMFESDGAANHGKRLADWIVEKMGGEGTPWIDSGREGLRQVSHSRAWHSQKRPQHERGRRFKLPDCRVWMRLMFLAGRQTGLNEHAAFWTWYTRFIQHFVGVYEMTAPMYAEESAEWSENPENVRKYIEDNNWTMKEILNY